MSGSATNTNPSPCGWCGVKPRVEGDGRKDKFAWVECPGCGASGPAKPTKVLAVGAWNQAMRWIAEGKVKAKGDAA